MNLTGQCEIDFEKWYVNNYDLYMPIVNGSFTDKEKYPNFKFNYPQSMQYGVYVDFFDGFNFIDIDEIYNGEYYLIAINYQNEINHRLEARIEAIKTANEIYNKVKK